MRKDSTPRDMLLDKRVVERNMKKGLVTKDEYERALGALVDVADQAEVIRARLGVEDPPALSAASSTSESDYDDDDDDEDEPADEAN